MERQLKQRVVGAALLVAFGVIFIPIFLDNDALETAVPPTVDIPPPPEDAPAAALPLDEAAIDALATGIDAAPEAPPEGAGTRAPAESDVSGETVPESKSPSPAPETEAQPLPAPEPAPPEPAKPAAAPPESVTAAMSGWAIQLGSFSSEVNARRLLDTLRAGGYTAYLERHREGTTTVFKVRVGPERERADAERLRDRLEREFATKGILRPYR